MGGNLRSLVTHVSKFLLRVRLVCSHEELVPSSVNAVVDDQADEGVRDAQRGEREHPVAPRQVPRSVRGSEDVGRDQTA
jgi:hypothetical protein